MIGTPINDRKAKRREATRREIIDAAWAVARQHGLAALTLREVAARVGMRAPSLYSHFDSKNAIYDAMFGQAWHAFLDLVDATDPDLPGEPRARLKAVARQFFDFAVADVPRYQLMTQQVIAGFTPSAEAYAPAVQVIERLRQTLAQAGARDDQAMDLFTALISGLVSQQLANEPGGQRWRRLIGRAIDMYADELNLPAPAPRTTAARRTP
jgi:AcrR family transcriptional regulator